MLSSEVSEVANHTLSLDWNVAAAAIATFIGTLAITVWGWFRGKGKMKEGTGVDVPVSGVALMDNQSLREATAINKEIRDNLILHTAALNLAAMRTNENNEAIYELCREVKRLRNTMEG